jgi:hypothetical protein
MSEIDELNNFPDMIRTGLNMIQEVPILNSSRD